MNLTELLTGGNTTLASVLWPMIAGVILAACLVFFNKQTLGKLVKALFDAKANSPETAKSLKELGLDKHRLLRLALRPDTTLRKVVYAVEQKEGEEIRYYIPEDRAYRAEVTYNPDGSSVMTLLIAAVAFIAVAVILMSVVPDLVKMFSAAFGGSSGNG